MALNLFRRPRKSGLAAPEIKAAGGPQLTVDLAALAANYNLVKSKLSPGCEASGVVKASGYGLGVAPVAQALAAQGCRTFFVATPDEALELRGTFPDRGTVVAVLGGLYRGAEKDYAAHGLTPVLGSLENIERWRPYAARDCMIHFDTGMNRLGLGPDETERFLSAPPGGLRARAILSHFACADDQDHPLTQLQLQRFAAIARHFPQAKKSLANSSGLFRENASHYDLVRPGMCLYGLNPLPEANNPMRPVVRLETPVLQIRNVRKGQSIGYGAAHVFAEDSVTATVALGYADGFLRALSGKGVLYWQGQPMPILGRVSMDLVTLDLTGLQQKPVPGDMVEVIGPHQSADALADAAGTIGYEILTSLGRRHNRIYLPA